MKTAYRTLAAILAALALAPASPAGDKGLGVRIVILDDGDAAVLGEPLHQILLAIGKNPVRLALPGKVIGLTKPNDAKHGAGLPVSLTATGNKLIIASDDPKALDLAQELVRLTLNQPCHNEAVFPLKHARAADVARILDALFNGPPPPEGEADERPLRLRVTPDAATNSLTVKANPIHALMIHQLLKTSLDVPGGLPEKPAADKGLGVRIILLDDGDAASLGEAIQHMFPRVAPNPVRLILPGKTIDAPASKDGALPVTLTATGNKLIVASDDPKALDLVGKMARMIDSAEQMSEQFFPLKHAAAKDVAKVIDALFNGSPEERAARALAGKPRVARLSAVAVRGNTLSVMAKPLDLVTIKRLLETALDVAPKADSPVEALVVPLRSAAAAEVARLLQRMYRDDRAVQVSIGPGGNSLAIRAPAAARQEIEKLIKLLDDTAAGK